MKVTLQTPVPENFTLVMFILHLVDGEHILLVQELVFLASDDIRLVVKVS